MPVEYAVGEMSYPVAENNHAASPGIQREVGQYMAVSEHEIVDRRIDVAQILAAEIHKGVGTVDSLRGLICLIVA